MTGLNNNQSTVMSKKKHVSMHKTSICAKVVKLKEQKHTLGFPFRQQRTGI